MVAIAALAVATVAFAQAKPDFSGTWKFSASNPANYPGSAGWGVPSPTIVVKQSATEISLISFRNNSTIQLLEFHFRAIRYPYPNLTQFLTSS